MILLQTVLPDSISLFKWSLILLIAGLVIYRVFIFPRRNRKAASKAEVDDNLYRDRKSPLENILRQLIWGRDIHRINADRFNSPLLAAIFTRIPLTFSVVFGIIIISTFFNGGWQGGIIILAIAALFFFGHANPFIKIWRKEQGGKDILAGLYWYYKDYDKSLEHLTRASEVNNDPFIPYIIAYDLDKKESRKPEEERDHSEVIWWLERVVNSSKYDIEDALRLLIPSLNRNERHEEALSYLSKYKDEYDSEIPWEYQIAYQGIAEKYELQCDLEQAVEYYEKVLEISSVRLKNQKPS